MLNSNKLLYGVAYYHEYLPRERLEEDVRMMRETGITVVRIAESTWSTLEPRSGVFDFRHIDPVLEAMGAADIKVIVGTPTYAVPAWLTRQHPEVLATTAAGRNRYGPRQTMDITSPAYLLHAERVIRALLSHVAGHPAVIGYQADNETKHYFTSGPNVQAAFVEHLKDTFGTLQEINSAWGLDYWSNRIEAWEDFPEPHASINFSLTGEFAAFQRSLVTRFLAWQVSIIDEYRRPHQFVTHNFDFEWRGHSFGVQPAVDHFRAARAFSVVACDIYHPSQDQLTGAEIAFGGDLARSLKRAPYLVMETQAQGFLPWTPYPGQLRLQAFSHVASGAAMVAYWHWHSIHNSFETYWKGLLSHDFAPNPTYREAATIGADFARLGPSLAGLRIRADVAILISNRSLTAIDSFKRFQADLDYNDVLRRFYDELHRLSVRCDFIDTEEPHFDGYSLVIVPSLYAAPDSLLDRLDAFARSGGRVIYGLRSGFADEQVKVRACAQPGLISEACGASYSQFVLADGMGLRRLPTHLSDDERRLSGMAELLAPEPDAEVMASYDHPVWGEYAAVVRRRRGCGSVTYFGCLPGPAVIRVILADELKAAGLWGAEQESGWPLVTKIAENGAGRAVRFYFNYSAVELEYRHTGGPGRELLGGVAVRAGQAGRLPAWGVAIVEEGV